MDTNETNSHSKMLAIMASKKKSQSIPEFSAPQASIPSSSTPQLKPQSTQNMKNVLLESLRAQYSDNPTIMD